MSIYRSDTTLLSQDEAFDTVCGFTNPGSSMMASIVIKNTGSNPLTGLRLRLEREAGALPQVLDPHSGLSDRLAERWGGALPAGETISAILMIPPGKTHIQARAAEASPTTLVVWRAAFPKETILEPMLDGQPMSSFKEGPVTTPIFSGRLSIPSNEEYNLFDELEVAELIYQRKFISIQVIGTSGPVVVANASSTAVGTVGNVLNPASAATKGGGYLEDNTYCGDVCLRSLSGTAVVQVEIR